MKFREHDLAVITHEPDAVVWRVIGVEGQFVDVVDAALQERLAKRGIRPTPQTVHRASLKRLTYDQLNAWNNQG